MLRGVGSSFVSIRPPDSVIWSYIKLMAHNILMHKCVYYFLISITSSAVHIDPSSKTSVI